MSSYKFSKRTAWEFDQNKLTSLIDELKDKKVSYINLTQSNPTECGFEYNKELVLSGFEKEENLNYSPESKGLLCARKAICKYYQKRHLDVSVEQIILTSSTSEAYNYLFRLLADPKDQILFPNPSYPLFQFLCDLNDVELVNYPLDYKKIWSIDEKELRKNINPKTKALAVVNPNNPTGSYISFEQKQMINHLCTTHQLAVISDEVFFDFCLDGENHGQQSFIGNNSVLTFSLGGLSKALGMPQMKLSWIIVNGPEKQQAQAMERLEMIADTYLSVNTPVQNILEEWLSMEDYWQNQIKQRLQENLSFIKKTADSTVGMDVLHTQGGWSVLVSLVGISDEEQFVLDLLLDQRILIYPGYFFDFKQEGIFILSLLTHPKEFSKGVKILSERYQKTVS